MKTLYVLQKDKQIQKSPSTSARIHIKKCVTYTLSKNKKDALGLKKETYFHSKPFICRPSAVWYIMVQVSPKPWHICSKELTIWEISPNKDLLEHLVKIFSQCAYNAVKLLTLENTQSIENFNQLVYTKIPKNKCVSKLKKNKNKFYSNKESTSHSIASVVC